MTDRLNKILSLIKRCKVFADVGCDHGYISQAVLKNNLADIVYLCDISKPSLKKADNLLKVDFNGKYQVFLTDGLINVPYADQVLIAGMGGEEICKILKNSAYKPENLILQPMKNVEKVRLVIKELGYGIVKDFVFYSDKKYYDILCCNLGYIDNYTEKEMLFGRDNLSFNADFIRLIKSKLQILKSNIKKASDNSKKDMIAKANLYEEILNDNK